jgi:phosphonatase-like hydrolase
LLKKHGYPYISELFVQEMHVHFMKKMTDFYLHHETVHEKEGASDIFEWCKGHDIKVALDTGFDRSIVTPLLERMGWEKRGLIDASVTSDEVNHGRPSPDMINKLMEVTGVTDATDIAKVGDTIYDLQEGANAGCGSVIGITSGAYTRDQLLQGPYTHLIDHLGQLKEIFNE